MKKLTTLIDLAFCLVVLPLMIVIFPVERWFSHFPVYMSTLVAWFYLLYFSNRYVTIPYLLNKGKGKFVGAVLLILSFCVTLIFASIRLYTPKPYLFEEGIITRFPNFEQYQQAVWALFMIVEAVSFAVGLLAEAMKRKERLQEMEVQMGKAELAIYRAQIKPHFLFNALNSIYGLFLTKNENALPALEQFIEIVRYIHLHKGREFVYLSDEEEYLRKYIEFQSLRLNEKTKVEFQTDIEDYSLSVVSLLLISFVENCFKHGVSSAEASTIRVSMTEKKGELTLRTENKVFRSPESMRGEHTGIENSRKRLNLIYPSRHSLQIEEKEGEYRLTLKINLKL